MHRLALAAVTDTNPTISARFKTELTAPDGGLVAAGKDKARMVPLPAGREGFLIPIALPAQFNTALEFGRLDRPMVLANDDLQFHVSCRVVSTRSLVCGKGGKLLLHLSLYREGGHSAREGSR